MKETVLEQMNKNLQIVITVKNKTAVPSILISLLLVNVRKEYNKVNRRTDERSLAQEKKKNT